MEQEQAPPAFASPPLNLIGRAVDDDDEYETDSDDDEEKVEQYNDTSNTTERPYRDDPGLDFGIPLAGERRVLELGPYDNGKSFRNNVIFKRFARNPYFYGGILAAAILVIAVLVPLTNKSNANKTDATMENLDAYTKHLTSFHAAGPGANTRDSQFCSFYRQAGTWDDFVQHVASLPSLARCQVDQKICQCGPPTRGEALPPNNRYYDGWTAQATLNRNWALSTHKQMDVVIYGDTNVESMWGTVYGKPRREYAHVNSLVYEKYFSKHKGGKIDGLALGIGGDTASRLMYRIKNNSELPPNLKSKVYWILIGTNDFVTDKCKADCVIAGNIAIAKYILAQKPNSQVVINSILPRGNQHQLDYWTEISEINSNLACFASETPRVHFFNATDIFIAKSGNAVDMEMLPDGLHFQQFGAKKWAEAITEVVLAITKE